MAESKEKLLQAVHDLAEDLEETPSAHKMRKVGKYSGSPYYRVWDSWFDVLAEAGLEPTESSKAGHPVSEQVPMGINNDGHYEVNPSVLGRKETFMIHRLHATLLVDDVSELSDKEIHHKNGCPFDNRLDNYQLIEPKRHRRLTSEVPRVANKTALCRVCGTASYSFTEDPQYCRECGSEYDSEEVTESSYIDWGSYG
jgi:hypothetical protein